MRLLRPLLVFAPNGVILVINIFLIAPQKNPYRTASADGLSRACWPEATIPATGRSEPVRWGERHGLAALSRSSVSAPGRSLLTRSGTFYSPLCAAIRALCHRPYPPGTTSDAPSIARRRVFCWSDGAWAADSINT